jgi:hypothetical protein
MGLFWSYKEPAFDPFVQLGTAFGNQDPFEIAASKAYGVNHGFARILFQQAISETDLHFYVDLHIR